MKLDKKILDQVRDVEGFPIGKDEDIIKLSDPPHYTACPNPFIEDFIKKHGTPYNEEKDDYDVEPYASDISEGKNDPIYRAHSYHTKVPHKAIMRYILHYTKPGDIVFDGFCGTGMTGVAAQMCGNPDSEFKLQVEKEMPYVEWGTRKVILNDLSSAATFIAYNYNTPVDIEEFEKEAKRIIEEVEEECGWMYETQHMIDGNIQYDITGKPIIGKINYTVWSDVFICPNCAHEIVFWDVAVDEEKGKVKKEFQCDNCCMALTKRDLNIAMTSVFDDSLGVTIQIAKQVPVMINYIVGKKRYNKKPDKYDLEVLEKINSRKIPYWHPIDRMPNGYNTAQPKKSHGITHVHHFYTKRNLWVLSAIYDKIMEIGTERTKKQLLFLFTSVFSRTHKLNRYMPNHNRHVGPLSGTLYIPSLQAEINIIDLVIQKNRRYESTTFKQANSIIATFSSTNCINIADRSMDYIFTDPPFGANIMYSELNFIWEAWLKVFTNNKTEAIINKVQGKNLPEYQELMEQCFKEYYRVLKPGRWMTVEFNNSKNSIWNCIQEAIMRAGFVVSNIMVLDKKKGTTKQLSYTNTTKQDLIISAYKPKDSFVEKFMLEAGTEEGVWEFIREHLKKLPIVVEKDGMVEIIPERQNYFLYDTMVAFHVQRGVTIPMGAVDFYKGLDQRFPERDGMYFLPNQVNEYDSVRIKSQFSGQLSMFVFDEKSAIQWLYYELETPQTYQDIMPKYLKELRQLKHEKLPELLEILEENFLQDEEGRWYIPDLNRRSDLEKIREKNLLKEFEDYKKSKGRLKKFRTEAVRAGFKKAWHEKDYNTIIEIGDRLPTTVLQEDSTLLMYYDNAITRIGD